ncbi:MAG: U32 family peptidase [Lachnospiraceae bacterium]|nr:U32 family peptidase [Lachnospiraceae bacterium]
MKKQVELLAPAGSWESMQAAMAAGADAVYMGGLQFGARAYAHNLDQDKLCRAIDFAHLHGGRLYLTVNTLLKEEELEGLTGYLRPFYQQGLDGVIVQDLGVWDHIRRELPGLPLHVSTQMTLLGAAGAALLKEMGASRMVPARELSLEEIRSIKQEVAIEVETFVHGALCYCYSGQCLFSSLLGGRSGNRGRCAQPCRLPYQAMEEYGGKKRNKISQKGEEYLLSPRDLCTIEMLPELIEAGIDSFKIEGRMKRPEYTAGVVQIYRKYMDRYEEQGRERYRVEQEDMEILRALYNRGGFTQGYYQQKNGRKMISLVRPNHFEDASSSKDARGRDERRSYEELLSWLRKAYVEQEKKEKIQGTLKVSKEKPNVFLLEWKGIQVQVEGEPAQEPKNRPMSEQEIRRQMEKTGNTPFVWEHLTIETEEAVFIPLQSLNQLRRQGLRKLEEEICGRWRRAGIEKPDFGQPSGREKPDFGHSSPEECQKGADGQGMGNGQLNRRRGDRRARQQQTQDWRPILRVQVDAPWMLEPVLAEPLVDGVYVDGEAFFCSLPGKDERIHVGTEVVGRCQRAGKSCYLVMPDIFRQEQQVFYEKWFPDFWKAGFQGILVRNLEEVQFLRQNGYKGEWIPDAKLYTFNREARQVLMGLGAACTTLPYELNEWELQRRGCQADELVVYGYQPMMVTANCVAKTLHQCRKEPGLLYLQDRYRKMFPVRRCCAGCYNIIYNSAPLYLLDCTRELFRLQPGSLRLHFTMEEKDVLKSILQEAVRIFKKGAIPSLSLGNFTRGHLKRGVE